MRLILGCLVLCLVMNSCSESTGVSSLPSGTLVGTTHLLELDSILPDHSGIQVSIDGTNLSTVTDAEGAWRIDNVPTRTLNIRMSKEGYGTYVVYSVPFLGGEPTRVGPYQMYHTSACPAIFDNIIVAPGMTRLNSHLNCIPEEKTCYVAYFFSNSPDVSSDLAKHNASALGYSSGGSATATASIHSYMLNPGGAYYDSGLRLDDSIYVVAYALGGYDGTVEPLSGKALYPSIHDQPSRVLAFKFIKQ
jgi:hypothetical protein